MSQLKTLFFPKKIDPPPVIYCAKKGAIRRHFCADTEPRKARELGPRLMRQRAEAEQTRQAVFEAIAQGHDSIAKLVKLLGRSTKTIWTHVSVLVAEHKVDIERNCRPWRIVAR